MGMSRLSRRRWLALVAGLGGGLTFACGQPPAPPAAPATSAPASTGSAPAPTAAPAAAQPTGAPKPAAQPTSPPAPAPTQAAPAAGKRAEILTATQLALPPSLFWGVPNGWSNLSKVDALTGDWLVIPDADGTLIPRLAREVPTLQNGGARF